MKTLEKVHLEGRIAHGDHRPANVLIRQTDGQLHLIDFMHAYDHDDCPSRNECEELVEAARQLGLA